MSLEQPLTIPPEVPEKTVPYGEAVRAFDAHFHLDRLARTIWGHIPSRDKTVQDVLNFVPPEHDGPENLVKVEGGVLVYCDPPYNNIQFPGGKWRTAIGIHPTKVDSLTAEH